MCTRSFAPSPACAYFPCVVFAAASLARPSGVRGPVLFPPCDQHRPFAIAGAWQAQPVVRAFAPQRGARLGLPRGLPLRSGPSRRCAGACPGIATMASGTAVVREGAVIGVICDPDVRGWLDSFTSTRRPAPPQTVAESDVRPESPIRPARVRTARRSARSPKLPVANAGPPFPRPRRPRPSKQRDNADARGSAGCTQMHWSAEPASAHIRSQGCSTLSTDAPHG
jgi:hypothetical protein